MKLFRIIILFATPLLFVSCSSKIEKNIERSDTYSVSDIEAAMSVVEKKYMEFITTARPISLTYNEKDSDRVIHDFLPTIVNGKSSKGTEVIVLNSDIKTDLFSGSLSPLTTYSDFYWILEKSDSSWEIIYGHFLN